jgi:hypothetical protein
MVRTPKKLPGKNEKANSRRTIISYPLCPFFVVFCNVVGTSCASDFELLQDVTDGVSSLVTGNRYVAKLHKLCVMLIDLIRPLVQATSAGAVPAPQRNPQLNSPEMTPLTCPIETQYQHSCANVTAALNSAGNVGMGNVQPCENMYGGEPFNSWNDNMMWQLFQTNPSLDWFNSDILKSGFEMPDTGL